jgi:hypothetical protein
VLGLQQSGLFSGGREVRNKIDTLTCRETKEKLIYNSPDS